MPFIASHADSSQRNTLCDDREIQRRFLFVSGRDKDLKPTLQNVLPRNKVMSCAKHIDAWNVCQKFLGKICGWYVMVIANLSHSDTPIPWLIKWGWLKCCMLHITFKMLTMLSDSLWRSTHSPPCDGITWTICLHRCAQSGMAGGGRKHYGCYVIKNLDLWNQAHWLGAGQGCALRGTDFENVSGCAACITVNESVVYGCGDFKVMEPLKVQDCDKDP